MSRLPLRQLLCAPLCSYGARSGSDLHLPTPSGQNPILNLAVMLAAVPDKYKYKPSHWPFRNPRTCVGALSTALTITYHMHHFAGREEWMAKVKEDPASLASAPEYVKDDRDIVLAAIQSALVFGAAGFCHASERLRSDRDIALAAIKSCCTPTDRMSVLSTAVLQHVADPLSAQDPVLLRAAGLTSDHLSEAMKTRLLVISSRFSLRQDCTAFANEVLTAIRSKQQQCPMSKLADCAVYTPNEYKKGFCGTGINKDRWTDRSFPCRGWHPTSSEEGRCSTSQEVIDDKGRPLRDTVCWRYSFRWHLEQAHQKGGCMIQLLEGELGDGQMIEQEMATAIGIKIVKINSSNSIDSSLDTLAKEL